MPNEEKLYETDPGRDGDMNLSNNINRWRPATNMHTPLAIMRRPIHPSEA
jgi:hypothetical protein